MRIRDQICGLMKGCISPQEAAELHATFATVDPDAEMRNLSGANALQDPENILSDAAKQFISSVGIESAFEIQANPTRREQFCNGPVTCGIGKISLSACPFSAKGRFLQKIGGDQPNSREG